jgi:REP element-mobilizing transposase RayT
MNQGNPDTGDPIGYFFTWTTYGTWLPGDDRGWNKKGEADIQPPNSLRLETAVAEMKETAFLLSEGDRQIVVETIRAHCEIRAWKLHGLNARTNHVHVVVTTPGYPPETVRDQFKAWCTRKLQPNHHGRQRFWTEGASCRWINHEDDLEAAIEYTIEAQDRKRVEYQ